MAVFKATQNKSNTGGVFKATKKKSYDSAAVSEWQSANEESSKKVNYYGEKINNGAWLSAEELYDYRSALDNYIETSNRLRGVNKTYGTSYSEDDEKSWNDTVSALQNGYSSAFQYYSQFGSEIDMKEFEIDWTWDETPTAESIAKRQEKYQSNIDRIAEIEKALEKENDGSGNWFTDFMASFFDTYEEAGYKTDDKTSMEKELDSLRASNERYEALQKVLDAWYTPDAEEYKQSASAGWEKYLAVQAKAQANAPSAFEETVMKGFSTASDNPFSQTYNSVVYDYRNDDTYRNPNEKWSEEQKQMFGHLYNKHPAAAYMYATEINNRINAEKEEEALKSISEMATSGFWAGAGNTIGAIAAAPLGLVDILNDTAMIAAGRPVTTDGAISPFEYSQAVTGSIGTHLNDKYGTLDEDIPIIGGKGWGDVYGLGVSIANSWVSKGLGGTGTLINFFGQGAASGFDDAKKRGATDEEALLYAISLGAFEGIAEKFSIEKLLSAKTTGNFIKDFFKTMGNQFLSEAQEEGLTSLLSNIADNVIMGDKSNFNALVEQYMWQGMSESEAKKKAWKESVEGILFDTVAGGISGGISGGMQATVNHIGYNAEATKHGQSLIKQGSTDPLMQLAESMHGVSKTVDKRANKVTSDASAKNVGRLSLAMQDSITEQNRAEIEKALTEKGLSKKDAKRVAEYLASTSKLTAEQTAEVEGNEKIKAVVKELIFNPKSSVNDRINGLDTARLGKYYKIASDKVTVGEEAVIKEFDVKDKVSKDGKTIDKSTGEAVTIDKNNPIARIDIEKDDKGKVVKRTVYYNTDKGKIASEDISFANETEALLYEAFVDMNPAIANGIIKNYDGKTPIKTYISGMREGVLVYGMHNFQGVGKDISKGSFLASLSEADQAIALRIGRNYASTIAKNADNTIKNIIKQAEEKTKASEGTSTDTSAKKKHKKGKVSFEDSVKNDKGHLSLNKEQKQVARLAKHLASAMGIDIVFYDARKTKLKDGIDSNGYFDEDTDTIYLDVQRAKSDKKTIAFTLSHELVHFIKKWSPTKFDTFAKFLVEQYAAHGVNTSALLDQKMRKYGNDVTVAYEEMIADACETMLLDSNAVVKLMELRKTDLDLFEKIKLHILKILNSLRDMYKKYEGELHDEAKYLLKMTDVLEQMYSMFEEASVDAVQNYQAVESLADLEPNTDILPVEGTVKHSYKSLANAAGFDAIEDENGNRAFIRDGKAVSKVTVEDIENSPIGAFINYSLDNKDITKEQADEQKKMFADICTLCCQTNDFSMTMQFVGSEVFTAMKANADKQYGTTYDMPSICTKTQAVIDAMSARMVKLGRGLTTEEITAIYNEVNHSGNPVPCPECYVFSRWIGIGGLLNNIKQYQDYYGKMSVSEVAEAYKKMRAEIEASAKELDITFGKAKGALVKKYTSEYNKLTDKIEKQENQGEKVKESDRKKLKELESMQNTVKAMTWIENVYFADSALTKVNKNFKVPDEVLFDLNMGEKFATQYKEAWAFRTTQGAGYGKAITPYAEVSLGEGVLVTNNTSNAIKGKQNGTLNNYFLQQNGQMNAESRKALDRARLKQKIQAFLGGQRFQSTSDARYENASDYLLAALEMQAMHGMVQVYTKVDGAVPAFEAWGFSTNQSLMPKNGGFDADGNVKDTSVGGMNPKVAIANRNKHEHAGTITIGVNDNHIRALFAMIERDFIIPYHASGGKADVVAEFRRIQEGLEAKGTMVRSTDYSRTQSDKVLSNEVLKWLGKTDAEIEQIHKVREARIAILTGGKVDIEVVRANRFLSALYDKFHGGEWDGVKLAKGKVSSQIFPNEYWDQSVTYEESGQITRDYLEYCDDLGFLHRFSGLVPSNGMLVPVNGYDENGNRVALTDLAFKYKDGKKTNEIEEFYWKVLTDRRMYGHNGQYLPQQIVSLNSTTTDTVTSFAKHNDGRQYNKEVSLATAKKVESGDLGIKKQVKEIVGESGKNYGIGVYLDSTKLSTLTDEEREKEVKRHIKSLGGKVFTAYDNDGSAVDIRIEKSHKKFKNERGRKVLVYQHMTNYLKNPVKQEVILLVDELILTARQESPEPARHSHDWLDNNGQNDWDAWTTYIQDKENTVWKAKLQIANSVNGEKILYEIYPIEKVEGVEEIDTTSTDDRISQEKPIVKGESAENSRNYSNDEKSDSDRLKKQAKQNTDRILMGSLFSGGGTLEAGLTYQMLDKQFGVEYDGKISAHGRR